MVYNLDYIENIIFRFLLDICEKINKTELIYSLYFLLYILLFFVHLEPPKTYVPIWLERNLGQPCACSFKFYCYTMKRLDKSKRRRNVTVAQEICMLYPTVRSHRGLSGALLC